MGNHWFWMLAAAVALVACEKPYVEDGGRGDGPAVVGSGVTYRQQRPDTLIAVNDTARFYLSGMEISGVMLQDYPTPSALIHDSRYRMPTKLEVLQVVKVGTLPDGYWQSGQRIMCYDRPEDAGADYGSTTFGTGLYYTFNPQSSVTRAGQKTAYCILPIRTERRNTIYIDVDDRWQ